MLRVAWSLADREADRHPARPRSPGQWICGPRSSRHDRHLLAVVGGDERRARVVWSHLVEPVVRPSRSTPGLTVTGLIARDGALRPLEGLASGSLTLAGAQARLAGLDLPRTCVPSTVSASAF